MKDHLYKSMNHFRWEPESREDLSAELWRIWRTEIKPHFEAEKEFLESYGEAAGYERDYIARVLEDQKVMEELAWRRGGENIHEFTKVLNAHIRYKEDYFLLRVQRLAGYERLNPIRPRIEGL